ncbi:MAG: hypothetical protein HY858_14585 [Candidatus Solibacter usitatus]|nr:hypothetical protein [Candidatus Solibacter usitatus]
MIQWVVDASLFRNANHAIWFFCTVGLLITLIVQRLYPRAVWSIPLTGVTVHVSPIVNALRVCLKEEQSELYTPDCIAFNAFMLGMYAVVFFWFLKQGKRKNREIGDTNSARPY